MKRSPLPSRESGKLTMFFGTARIVKMDAQGRIVLPEKSMSRAIVAEKVTVIGNDDHLEIWPTDEWEQHLQTNLNSYGEILYEAADRINAQADRRAGE